MDLNQGFEFKVRKPATNRLGGPGRRHELR
jgi:hypothetical protein